ncbi:MAG: divergent polysaccharide deacetylase family protein [Alphaproteobacteria bacterium]|nr:divergent polysaccharide deacetylase family protein [Alphaproteobacteria bacterium]
MKKNGKSSKIWQLSVLPIMVSAVVAALIFVAPEPPAHEPLSIRVAVKDQSSIVEETPVPSLSIDDLHQPLRLDVKDPKKPPEVTPEPVISLDILDKKFSLPLYEEKNLAPDVPIPVITKPKFRRGEMPERPSIAIVIDDLGLNISLADRAILLPAGVTLSFLPYSMRLQEQADKARAAGHELLLHMPMQPVGADDPGPGALLTSLSADEVQERLKAALDSFSGFDGVNNHMGSKFTSDASSMVPMMKVLQQRDLFFLDSRTSGQSVGAKIAREQEVLFVGRDVFLDNDVDEKAIREQLFKTEQIAKYKGHAIAIGHPHVATINALESWIKEIQSRGIDLVPVRELVK